MKISSLMQDWSYHVEDLEDWKSLYDHIIRCVLWAVIVFFFTDNARQKLTFKTSVMLVWVSLSLSLSLLSILPLNPRPTPKELLQWLHISRMEWRWMHPSDEFKLTPCARIRQEASTILLKEEPWRKLQFISRCFTVVDANLRVKRNDSWLFGMQN